MDYPDFANVTGDGEFIGENDEFKKVTCELQPGTPRRYTCAFLDDFGLDSRSILGEYYDVIVIGDVDIALKGKMTIAPKAGKRMVCRSTLEKKENIITLTCERLPLV